jgi:hypothetical protein
VELWVSQDLEMQRDPLIVGNIVGDVVDYFDASARLRVFYNNREMIIGSELRPSHVANQPMVQISGLFGSLYTLVSSLRYTCSMFINLRGFKYCTVLRMSMHDVFFANYFY